MKIILTRAARLWHKAGDAVEASPEEAAFLISVGSAVKAEEAEGKAQPQKKAAAKKTK